MQRSDTHQASAYYVSPCGRRLRNMDELKHYLDITGITSLTGIHFTFDPYCSLSCPPFGPQQAEEALVYIEDISKGKENVPVSCVNFFTREEPDCMLSGFEYLTSRSFEPHIAQHAQEPEFMVCCSCTDGCVNRSKCECWQLTQQEARTLPNLRYSVGYVHQRLKRPQHSAVYECNIKCECKGRCSNSVVQAGIVHRLQLFHTGKPQLNWGLRSLDDIPMGTFVCSYFGHVYTEMGAEKKALQHGDEYFAGLDYIEVMEYHKAGYEVEVSLSDESSLDSSGDRSQASSSFFSAGSERPVCSVTSSATSSNVIIISSDSEGGDSDLENSNTDSLLNGSTLISDSPLSFAHTNSSSSLSHHSSSSSAHSDPPSLLRPLKTRQYYKEDFNYIIDAKTRGNMARYINHSCDPNLFVQNVFVDTHDLRFPWVAFFAKRRIKAMEELTWDYNYEIGSVEGKEIPCLCGSSNCRKRLL